MHAASHNNLLIKEERLVHKLNVEDDQPKMKPGLRNSISLYFQRGTHMPLRSGSKKSAVPLEVGEAHLRARMKTQRHNCQYRRDR
jgi:hypothetical protein